VFSPETGSAVYRAPYGLVFQDLMGLAAAKSGVPRRGQRRFRRASYGACAGEARGADRRHRRGFPRVLHRVRFVEGARSLRLANVDFLGMQGPGRWEEMMQAPDVLLVNQRESVADMSLPSKLTSYFAAGRPVVAACSPESETAREIREAGAGYVVGPGTPLPSET
jgi:hypothetical protein